MYNTALLALSWYVSSRIRTPAMGRSERSHISITARKGFTNTITVENDMSDKKLIN